MCPESKGCDDLEQALSKRVHYGKFVAEAKFLASREEYGRLIRQRDAEGIMRLLTNEAVEKEVSHLNPQMQPDSIL